MNLKFDQMSSAQKTFSPRLRSVASCHSLIKTAARNCQVPISVSCRVSPNANYSRPSSPTVQPSCKRYVIYVDDVRYKSLFFSIQILRFIKMDRQQWNEQRLEEICARVGFYFITLQWLIKLSDCICRTHQFSFDLLISGLKVEGKSFFSISRPLYGSH